MKLGTEVGLGPGHTVLDGDPAFPPLKGHSPPIFGSYLLWQTAGWINMSLGREVDLGPGDIVFRLLDGALIPRKRGEGTTPPILTNVYCGQTIGWIKMKLGMEVALDPDDIVLDRDPVSSPKGAQPPPIFGSCLLWPNG